MSETRCTMQRPRGLSVRRGNEREEKKNWKFIGGNAMIPSERSRCACRTRVSDGRVSRRFILLTVSRVITFFFYFSIQSVHSRNGINEVNAIFFFFYHRRVFFDSAP